MNKVFGGTVHKKCVREDGVFSIGVDNTCSLFRYSFLHFSLLSSFTNQLVIRVVQEVGVQMFSFKCQIQEGERRFKRHFGILCLLIKYGVKMPFD